MTLKLFPAAVVVLLSTRAFAQEADPVSDAKVRIGPLGVTPTLSLVNAGVDTNVFNEPDQAAPKRDFTVTVQPKADYWLHVGRSMLLGNVTEDLVYYNEYATERSANTFFKVGIQIPMTRLTLNGSVSYLNTRDRPGFEIDARSQRNELTYDGLIEFRLLSKTFVGVKGIRQNVDFDKAAVFLGSNLHDELSREMTSEALTVRHALTQLTSLTLDVARQQERFPFSTLRDSDSTQIIGGVRFDPLALLKGGATLGYRNFEPRTPGVPSYKGTTAAVDLTYVALGSTKLSVQATRDVQYSYDINQPYYLQTGVNASVAQQIFGPVDVVGRLGVQRLDYRDRLGAVVAVSNRTDDVHTYGAGVGYHLGKDVRIGINFDKARRTSDVGTRQYDDFRFGTAVTYGL